jgi:predicted DNA-binding ribbon-helix-helix protein
MSTPPSGKGRLPRLLRPKWAGFTMEETFWASLEQICAKQEHAPGDYVARAKDYIRAAGRQFPNIRVDEAVRLRIAQDLRDQAMCFLSKRGGHADHAPHELASAPPVANAADTDVIG